MKPSQQVPRLYQLIKKGTHVKFSYRGKNFFLKYLGRHRSQDGRWFYSFDQAAHVETREVTILECTREQYGRLHQNRRRTK